MPSRETVKRVYHWIVFLLPIATFLPLGGLIILQISRGQEQAAMQTAWLLFSLGLFLAFTLSAIDIYFFGGEQDAA